MLFLDNVIAAPAVLVFLNLCLMSLCGTQIVWNTHSVCWKLQEQFAVAGSMTWKEIELFKEYSLISSKRSVYNTYLRHLHKVCFFWVMQKIGSWNKQKLSTSRHYIYSLALMTGCWRKLSCLSVWEYLKLSWKLCEKILGSCKLLNFTSKENNI